MLKKIKKFLNKWCERGQKCSCWFDGWWGKYCKKHDDYYMTKEGKNRSKLSVDFELFIDVTFSKPLLVPIGFHIALIMFLALSLLPISYKHWNNFKKEREV